MPHAIARLAFSWIAVGIVVGLIGFSTVVARPACGAEKGGGLPWEADFESARAKAAKTSKPLFVMMTAEWCGPCKAFEAGTLPHPDVRAALRDFVWVQAFEDKAVEAKYVCNGYPTLVFVDATGERVLCKATGGQSVGPFLKSVIEARRAAGLPLGPRLEKLAAKSFTPDFQLLARLCADGDGAGIKKHLQPADNDDLRSNDYLVGKLTIPSGVRLDEVLFDGAVGSVSVPESGVFVVPVPRSPATVRVRMIAPGCLAIDETVKFPKGKASVFKKFDLATLTGRDAIRVGGTVLLPDGRPAANAIVRICDWGAVVANQNGEYLFNAVTPGTFLVRGEYQGGEFHQQMEIRGPQQRLDIRLKPVTTVGIKWALQMEEGSRKLVGPGVRTGIAYFSVAHSRFSLERGAEVRSYWGSDLMLRDSIPDGATPGESRQSGGQAAAAGEGPVFWLFDGASHPSGLHLETAGFDSIVEVSADAEADPRGYFTFLRGPKVVPGQVFTVRCVAKDRYAKMEVIGVFPPIR